MAPETAVLESRGIQRRRGGGRVATATVLRRIYGRGSGRACVAARRAVGCVVRAAVGFGNSKLLVRRALFLPSF